MGDLLRAVRGAAAKNWGEVLWKIRKSGGGLVSKDVVKGNIGLHNH